MCYVYQCAIYYSQLSASWFCEVKIVPSLLIDKNVSFGMNSSNLSEEEQKSEYISLQDETG